MDDDDLQPWQHDHSFGQDVTRPGKHDTFLNWAEADKPSMKNFHTIGVPLLDSKQVLTYYLAVVTTSRKTTVERREEIARAVLRVIGERGLRSLTTATLAAEVGLTTGALFRHFSSLDEILIETVRDGVARIDATFPDDELPPLDRLLRLARNRIRLLRGDPGLTWLLRSEQSYLVLPEQAGKQLRDAAGRSKKFLLKALVEGAAQGTVRKDIEPEILLVTVVGTIHGVIGSGARAASQPARRSPRPDRVLSGLARLLQPSGVAE